MEGKEFVHTYICSIMYSVLGEGGCTCSADRGKVVNIPYRGKLLQNKISVDGSKNENSRIKCSQMLAYCTE